MGGRYVCLKKDDDVGCCAGRASGGCYAYFVGRDDIGYLAGVRLPGGITPMREQF